MKNKEQYSEYGYRGTEELRKANEEISKLKKEIEELKKLLYATDENK